MSAFRTSGGSGKPQDDHGQRTPQCAQVGDHEADYPRDHRANSSGLFWRFFISCIPFLIAISLDQSFTMVVNQFDKTGLATVYGHGHQRRIIHCPFPLATLWHSVLQGFRVKEGLSCVFSRTATARKSTQPSPSLTRNPVCYYRLFRSLVH